MKNITLIATIVVAVSGCQSTSTDTDTSMSKPTQNENCSYATVISPVFVMSDLNKKYASNYIKTAPTFDGYISPDAAVKLPLVQNGFKFTGNYSIDPNSRYVKWNDFFSDDGKHTKVRYGSSGSFAEIIDANCNTYWYQTGIGSVRGFGSGEELTHEQMVYVFGSDNVKVESENVGETPAEVIKDKFTKTITVKGIKVGSKFFRMFGSLDNGKLQAEAQYYTRTPNKDWMFLDRAHDEDGNRRDVTEIARETVSNKYTGVSIYEDVGVTFPISYLRTKTETGFEVKLSGNAGSNIIKVPAWQIQQIVNAYDNFQK